MAGSRGSKRITLTAGERESATDGTITWLRGRKAGQPIGVREMLRRKKILMDRWITPPITAAPTSKLSPVIGDHVVKTSGDYTFTGEVVGIVTKRGGATRYVVEDDRGLLLIMNEQQLRLAEGGDRIPMKGMPV